MDSTAFRAAIDASEVIILDGGLATQLEAQGADLSDALWSARLLADAPGEIVAAHVAYYRAGARVATTASYQATFEGFERRGITHDEGATLMRRSVALASEARTIVLAERAARNAPGPALFVGASIGPYGAMLADGSEYRGRYGRTVAQLRDFHRERISVLASTDADILAIETIPQLDEAVAVAGLLAETDGAAAWISFTCADGARLRSGVPIEEAVEAVDGGPGLLAIGINCTAPEHVDELVGRIAATTTLPVVVYPNSGEGWDAARRTWTGEAAGRVDAAAGRRWLAAGARLIGGCCRVTPDQVRAIADGLPANVAARP
jgi:homocysteine S-methyltransferase